MSRIHESRERASAWFPLWWAGERSSCCYAASSVPSLTCSGIIAKSTVTTMMFVNLEMARRAVEGGDKPRINRSVGDARQPTCDELTIQRHRTHACRAAHADDVATTDASPSTTIPRRCHGDDNDDDDDCDDASSRRGRSSITATSTSSSTRSRRGSSMSSTTRSRRATRRRSTRRSSSWAS